VWTRPTRLRGILFYLLEKTAPKVDAGLVCVCRLLDIGGRRVMALGAGARGSSFDVRKPAPGVYFVRRPGAEDWALQFGKSSWTRREGT
jgi:hypothetical protein